MRTVESKQPVAEMSVRVLKSFECELRKAALQDCRSFREEVVYLLEVMMTVLHRYPRFPLKRDYNPAMAVLKGQVRVDLPMELHDSLFHRAGEYGLRFGEFARLCLVIALDFRKVLGLKSRMVTKEDFIELILSKFRKQRIQ